MSERVTWERCPRCGGPAAVGWDTVARANGEPPVEVPVEYDCAAGCRLDPHGTACHLRRAPMNPAAGGPVDVPTLAATSVGRPLTDG